MELLEYALLKRLGAARPQGPNYPTLRKYDDLTHDQFYQVSVPSNLVMAPSNSRGSRPAHARSATLEFQ